MRYTIWSRGRLVGDSDLAFARVADPVRCGWFHPSAEGERLMPVATSMLAAIRASRAGDGVDVPGLPELRGPARRADVAEALQHIAALELELRDAAGTRIATEDIVIQDTYALLDLMREDESADDDGADWTIDDDLDAMFGAALEPGAGGIGEDDAWRLRCTVLVDDHDPAAPADTRDGASTDPALEERYQLFVTLVDPASIP